MGWCTRSLGPRNRAIAALAAAKFYRFRLGYKYSDEQPRDEQGRWVETDGDDEDAAAIVPVARRRNKIAEAECEIQYKKDLFHCNMVGLRSCYAQAQERYAACLVGRPIPPLSY